MFLNLPADLQRMIQDIKDRLLRLENGQRFTFPIVATDPAHPRNGDAWINSTSNTAKVVDKNGTVRTLTWT